MKIVALALFTLTLFGCVQNQQTNKEANLSGIAERYVRLGLAIGAYDEDFVDAYYGPDSLKPSTPKKDSFPKETFLQSVEELKTALLPFTKSVQPDSIASRARWIEAQLTAFERRIHIFSGDQVSFDQESKELFGVKAPVYEETHFAAILQQLDSMLPGKGDIAARFQQLAKKFIIPKNKIDTVFQTAITESRKRTLQHIELPAAETFSLEYVQDKPWSGYNWYKGKYTSLIQINNDNDIYIERAIDVASHESYPGHHVYNMLLEKNLYNNKGFIEISLYPLFSPQSFIAEGSANYGIAMAFPGNEKIEFAKNILLPLAGIDTTGTSLYFEALALKGKLNFVRNEVARKLLSNQITEQEAIGWLVKYGLSDEASAVKSIRFIRKYRSYVINYNYGQELVRKHIESPKNNSSELKWKAFISLLSSQVSSSSLEQ